MEPGVGGSLQIFWNTIYEDSEKVPIYEASEAAEAPVLSGQPEGGGKVATRVGSITIFPVPPVDVNPWKLHAIRVLSCSNRRPTWLCLSHFSKVVAVFLIHYWGTNLPSKLGACFSELTKIANDVMDIERLRRKTLHRSSACLMAQDAPFRLAKAGYVTSWLRLYIKTYNISS